MDQILNSLKQLPLIIILADIICYFLIPHWWVRVGIPISKKIHKTNNLQEASGLIGLEEFSNNFAQNLKNKKITKVDSFFVIRTKHSFFGGKSQIQMRSVLSADSGAINYTLYLNLSMFIIAIAAVVIAPSFAQKHEHGWIAVVISIVPILSIIWEKRVYDKAFIKLTASKSLGEVTHG